MRTRVWIFAATVLLAFSGMAFADDAPAPVPQSASIGGGVRNPWRPPYRTALVQPPSVPGQ